MKIGEGSLVSAETVKANMGNNKYKISHNLDVWLDNLSKTGRGRKQALSIGIDFVLVVLSLWGAYSLRLNELYIDFATTWHLFLLLPPFTVILIASLGIYRWVIRSSNRKLYSQLAKACVLSAILLALLNYLLPAGRSVRSVFVIYGLLLIVGTFSVRYLWQSLFDSEKNGEPVAIYGAGRAGSLLLQLLSQGNEYRPVLLLDDNPGLIGTTVGGLRVAKPDAGILQEILLKHDVGRVIMAMPSICLLYTSPSPRDATLSRMPSSA